MLGMLQECVGTASALRSAPLPVNLIGSPTNYANRLIGSPITSQSAGYRTAPRTNAKGGSVHALECAWKALLGPGSTL
jgi:hypothetical protein